VIVGGGTAGCVLAGRLSEDPDCRVLLLEAGGEDRRAEIHIPAAFSKLFKTEVDWAYETVPQPRLYDRALYWPRGKVLGGSSSMNAMIYIRGAAADYDGWAAAGCTGWGFADVLPYFKRSEDHVRGPSAWHGKGGPVPVTDPLDPSPVSLAFVEAALQAGLPRNDDFNGPTLKGAGLYQLTQRGGRRVSSAAAFLRPARSRPNLRIETGALATRIVFDGQRAVGVEFLQGGASHRVDAVREVLLCGGTVNSPQLLMLSGVGPANDLRQLGLPVTADRPAVGANLQDHPIAGLRYRLRRPISLMNAEGAVSVLRYLTTRRGMLTSNVAEAGAFVRTRADDPEPDVQYHVAPVLYEDHGLRPPTEHGFSIGPTLVAPRSVGRLALRSADPTEPPLIDPNYLADEADLTSLVKGLKVGREIALQPALASFRGEELTPGPHVHTDDALAAYVRATCETLYHPAGTCRMGADNDSVVDPDLRVRGVEGLRVVDASVMPTIVRGNTNAPTMMIAEKAADLLRMERGAEAASQPHA